MENLHKDNFIKKYSKFLNHPSNFYEQANKLFCELGSISFVHSILSRRIYGLNIEITQSAINTN